MPITAARLQRVNKEGSPTFPYALGVLAAGAVDIIDLESDSEFTDARKYLPLDWLQITNNDNVDLEVKAQYGMTVLVPAGAIKTISDTAMKRITVKNLHASTSTVSGKVKLLFQREPMTADKYFRGLA